MSWHIQSRLPEVLKKEPLGAQPAWHSSGSAKGSSLGEEREWGARESGIWGLEEGVTAAGQDPRGSKSWKDLFMGFYKSR